jgi:hypothetical protein
MKLNNATIWGLVLLTLGIGATLLSGGQTVWYGAVIVGLLNIGRGLAAGGTYNPAQDPALAESFDGDGGMQTQLTGQPCVHCARKLLGNFEGRSCGGCGGAVHRDCYRAHRDAAHPKVGGSPKANG